MQLSMKPPWQTQLEEKCAKSKKKSYKSSKSLQKVLLSEGFSLYFFQDSPDCLIDVPDRDRFKSLNSADFTPYMGWNNTFLKSKPSNFRKALIQRADAAYFPRKSNFAKSCHLAAEGPVQIA